MESARASPTGRLARSIFPGLSGSYDSVVEWMTLFQDRAWKRRMLEGLHVGPGMKILDVGCGTCLLEERSELGSSQVVGIDITDQMIRLAEQKDLKQVSLLGLADAEHLPFREETFDIVVSCYVPKYCETRRFVEELARVLKRGGRLAVYDFTMPRGPLAPALDLYIFGLMPLLGRLVAPLDASLAFTCGALPGLIRSTTWDAEIPYALEANGLENEGQEAMTGGTVTIFWASKGTTRA